DTTARQSPLNDRRAHAAAELVTVDRIVGTLVVVVFQPRQLEIAIDFDGKIGGRSQARREPGQAGRSPSVAKSACEPISRPAAAACRNAFWTKHWTPTRCCVAAPESERIEVFTSLPTSVCVLLWLPLTWGLGGCMFPRS